MTAENGDAVSGQGLTHSKVTHGGITGRQALSAIRGVRSSLACDVEANSLVRSLQERPEQFGVLPRASAGMTMRRHPGLAPGLGEGGKLHVRLGKGSRGKGLKARMVPTIEPRRVCTKAADGVPDSTTVLST
ncbi:hypothetical protein GCM10027161_32520 [Microbispora hainanensis]